MSGIERTPGVCGGDACIAGTRIPVWVLEGFRRLGWTEEIDEAIRQNEAA
jgi:uncharacterized protein (DUF433 family)